MNTEKTKLIGPPEGSSYFSQMHALRWRGLRQDDVADRLYSEILLQSLQSPAIIITDSHAVQNTWMRDLLDNHEKYKEIRKFVSAGIILIAKRRAGNSNDGTPLVVTAENQKGKAPVVINGKEEPMPLGFASHAPILDELTKNVANTPVYDIETLDLKARMKKVFNNPEICKNYGITRKSGIAEKLDEMIETHYFDKDGFFMAAKLYNLPDDDPYFAGFSDSIKGLATSVHSCNFAMSYHLPSATSTVAFDHAGAMSLYRQQIQDIMPFEQPDDALEDDSFYHSTEALKTGLTSRIVLEIRDSDEFEFYIKAQNQLMAAFRVPNQKAAQLLDVSKKFAEAADLYMERIRKVADVSIPHSGSEMRQHYSHIKNANSDAYWVWQRPSFLGGFVNATMSMEARKEEWGLKKSKETSQSILYGINRILNLI